MSTEDSGLANCYVCKCQFKVGDLAQKTYVILPIEGNGFWATLTVLSGAGMHKVFVHYDCGSSKAVEIQEIGKSKEKD